MKKLERGFVQLYTGNGKGKTTAAFGATLRAACHNYQVCFMQFLKGGHDAQSVSCIPNVTYLCFGKNHETDGWYAPLQPGEQPPKEIIDGWEQAKTIIANSAYHVIILDELNVALSFGFLNVQDVISTIKSKPLQREIIITGRNAPQELIEIADIATEMKEVRHMYEQGIPARQGFDF